MPADEPTIVVPGPNDDVLSYIAALFTMEEGAIPADAIVVFGFIGDIDPDDPASSGQYWQLRTSGEGISSTHIGLLEMASHRLQHVAADDPDGD